MKTTKLWLTTIATLLCSLTASADIDCDFMSNGICYNITSETTVSVTYNDVYYTYDALGTKYYNYYTKYSGLVVIPSTVTYNNTTYRVTSIGNSAFEDCSNLTSITIPESVTSIGDYAFYNCSSLTAVHIKDIASWCNIDFGDGYSNPLRYAKNLYLNGELVTELTIPNTVTAIKYGAFYNYSNLTSITIPENSQLTSIGSYAFKGCSSLTSITIPESVTGIGRYAFLDCSSLSAVHIKDIASWCNIDFYSDYSNPLYYAKNLYLNGELVTELTIPNTVTAIKYGAFYNYSNLTSITIPEIVTSIGGDAFEGTAWYNNQTDGVVYAGKVLYKYKGTMPANTSIEIKEGTVSISPSAFEGCSSLTSITIPESVTSIGGYAFSGCSGELTVNCNIPSASSSGGGAFYNSDFTKATIGESVTSIGDNAFSGCRSLTSITIPESVTSIGEDAFYGTAWYNNQPDGVVYAGKVLYKYKGTMPSNTSIEVKEGTVGIGSEAFRSCSNLTSITIPESVTSIGYKAFRDCRNLTSITIPENSQLTSIGDYAFYECRSLTSITIPESVTSIGESAFEGCSSLTSINIPDGVTSIESYTFYYCDGLTTINIPESVTTIGNSAFEDCSSLTSITIPESVTNIGNSAFRDCSSLTSITIPESVTTIGDRAFYGCIWKP